MNLPLRGIKVVELVHQVMGPSAGMILADFGADVVKVEPAPRGDNTRRLIGSGAGLFTAFNRNKRSIAVDLKNDDGREIGLRLIDQADVLIENFRLGALDEQGFGYATVSSRNPRLIYCSLKGFLSGPYAHRTALDEAVQNMAGLATMTGPPGQPLRAGASVNDIMGGMFTVIAVLAALRERETTGVGTHIKTGLFETCAFLVSQHVAEFCVTGNPPTPMSVPQDFYPVYDRFETSDDRKLFVAVVTDKQWIAFCDAFGLHVLRDDPELADSVARTRCRHRTIPIIAARFKTYSQADLMAICDRLGLPYAPIRRPEDLLADEHLQNSGGLLSVPTPQGIEARIPGLPVEIASQKFSVRRGVPDIGQDTEEILREAGYSVEAISRFEAQGTVVAKCGGRPT